MPELGILERMFAAGLSHLADQLVRHSLHRDEVFVGMALTVLGAYYVADMGAQRPIPFPQNCLRIIGYAVVGALSFALVIWVGFLHTFTGALIGACFGFMLQGTLALCLAALPTGEANHLVYRLARLLLAGALALLSLPLILIGAILYWLFGRQLRWLARWLILIGALVALSLLLAYLVRRLTASRSPDKPGVPGQPSDCRRGRDKDQDPRLISDFAKAPFHKKLITTLMIAASVFIVGQVRDESTDVFGELGALAATYFALTLCLASAVALTALVVDVLIGRLVGVFSRPLLVNDATGAEWLTTPINPTAYMLLSALVLGLLIGIVTAIVHKIGVLSASRFLVGFVAGLALGPFVGLSGATVWVVTTVAVIVGCLVIRWLASRAQAHQAQFGAALVCFGALLLFLLSYWRPIH